MYHSCSQLSQSETAAYSLSGYCFASFYLPSIPIVHWRGCSRENQHWSAALSAHSKCSQVIGVDRVFPLQRVWFLLPSWPAVQFSALCTVVDYANRRVDWEHRRAGQSHHHHYHTVWVLFLAEASLLLRLRPVFQIVFECKWIWLFFCCCCCCCWRWRTIFSCLQSKTTTTNFTRWEKSQCPYRVPLCSAKHCQLPGRRHFLLFDKTTCRGHLHRLYAFVCSN